MEIKFKRDTSFRKQFFVPDSFAHPAKMDAQLLIWIVENYTKKWETILDPMAGSGTTMLACGLSRNVVLVELEEKFCKMMRDNWAKVRMWPQLGHRMGTCDIIQGDARQLGGLLCDKIITSPPFFNTNIKKRFKSRKELEEFAKKTKLYKEGRSLEAIVRMIEKNWNADEGLLVDKCIFSPPYAETTHHSDEALDLQDFTPGRTGRVGGTAGNSDGQIGQLPYGSIDKIVTSPPYGDQDVTHITESRGKAWREKRLGGHKAQIDKYGELEEQIGNLPYGNIDAVISSPPYEGSDISQTHMTSDKRGDPSNPNYRPSWKRKLDEGYAQTKRPYHEVDAVVTSPPYSNPRNTSEEYDDKYDLRRPKGVAWGRESFRGRYSGDQEDTAQIGNLKSDSYLEAMLQVYAQCWSVLKDGGLMILVTKNFIRNKQVVRLDTDTIKLCEQAGFTFFERHYRKLPSQSFWRIIALLKCDHRKGSKQSPRCELELECPIKEKEVLVFLLGLEPEARQEAVEVVEKLCPQFINSSPKIEFEDVLVFQKMELKV